MSLNKLGAITKDTLIPLGSMVIIVAVAMWVGSLATKVDAMVVKDAPSRVEFNQMCAQLSKIEDKVDVVNTNLLKLATRDKQ